MRPRLIGLVLVALTLGVTGSTSAQEAERIKTTTTARMHECPQTTCAIVNTYPTDTELLVLGREVGEMLSGSDQWVQVKDPQAEFQGYIHVSELEGYVWEGWKDAPVIPVVSDNVKAIYQRGQQLGNNPNAFSKVGDCQNVTAYFLTPFDTASQYNLGDYADLQAAIDHFAGSWARESEAVNPGFNVASVLSPMWADPEACQKGENPMACEYRLHQPSFVIISMETWWSARPADEYEGYLRQVVQFWIDRGVVPILATKADNLEGDHSINSKIVLVGQSMDVPVWNFWRALQALPNHGLTDDNFHLTYARPFFNDAAIMQNGWPMRNLTALQAIDAVWRGVSS